MAPNHIRGYKQCRRCGAQLKGLFRNLDEMFAWSHEPELCPACQDRDNHSLRISRIWKERRETDSDNRALDY